MWRTRNIFLGLALCAGLSYCTKSSSPYASNNDDTSRVETSAVDSLTGGNWRITSLSEFGKEETGIFDYITFRFYADGTVKTLDQPDTAKGTWKYYGDQRENFTLQFQPGTKYAKLNGIYNFQWTNDHIFRLVMYTDGAASRKIEFRKLLAI
jgi:hypothetical protein